MTRPRSGEKQFVVKIQRPLSSSVINPPVLVYDESRKVTRYLPFTRGMRLMLGSDLKQYRWAYFKSGVLMFGDQAPDQEW